jgi:hypothetical protein
LSLRTAAQTLLAFALATIAPGCASPQRTTTTTPADARGVGGVGVVATAGKTTGPAAVSPAVAGPVVDAAVGLVAARAATPGSPDPPRPDVDPEVVPGPMPPASTDLPASPGVDPPAPRPEAPASDLPATRDAGIATVGCATCGGAGNLGPLGPCSTCGGTGTCSPGQGQFVPYEGHTFVGRFFGNLYQCLCAPDPCYQPSWIPEANASFFSDYARPQTLTRFRYDFMNDLRTPDRSEYFWAQSRTDRSGNSTGLGPKVPKIAFRSPAGRFLRGFPALGVNQFSFYTEAATAKASFFVEVPYRSLNVLSTPYYASNSTGAFQHSAGFADMNLGTKALLFDCELLQLTFQFKTYIPTGTINKGLGTGHVALEPSLLATLKLGPETYFQGQLGEWIPIGGDQNYEGSILRYSGSLNHVLYRFTPAIPLIGTFEFTGLSFQDGLYTDPLRGPVRSSGGTYFNLGPGLRMSICKNIDFGTAVAFPVTDPNFGTTIRTELRILY